MTQHYVFAHRILPGLAFSDPARFKALTIEQLKTLWAHAAEHATEGNPSAPQGLALDWDEDVMVITMPQPSDPPEAFFIAVDFPPEDDVRFLTLELGADLDGNQTNFLCGWDHKTHVQYGDGFPADREAFLDEVHQHL